MISEQEAKLGPFDWTADHVWAFLWLFSKGALVRDLSVGKLGRVKGVDLKAGRVKIADWNNAQTWTARPIDIYDI